MTAQVPEKGGGAFAPPHEKTDNFVLGPAPSVPTRFSGELGPLNAWWRAEYPNTWLAAHMRSALIWGPLGEETESSLTTCPKPPMEDTKA